MKTKTNKTKSPVGKSVNWFTGTAAAAAAVSSASGATVQITLSGNQITATTGNSLNADVTGDSIDDLLLTVPQAITHFYNKGAFVMVNGNQLGASSFIGSSNISGDAQFAGGGVGVPTANSAFGGFNIKYLNPVTFTDASINGGAATQGFLEVNSFVVPDTQAALVFTRLVFDDASTTLAPGGVSTGTNYNEFVAVPEVNAFSLLSLGAGGLILRRRRG